MADWQINKDIFGNKTAQSSKLQPIIQNQVQNVQNLNLDGSCFENNTVSDYNPYKTAEPDLNEENFTLEESIQYSVLELFSNKQQKMQEMFDEQNKNDGFISSGYNKIKEIFDFGVSDKDVQEAITKQSEQIKKLEDAFNGESELSFEETFKQICGVDFSSEKFLDYQQKQYELQVVEYGINKAALLRDSARNAKSTDELLELFTQYYQDEDKAKAEISQILKDSYNTSMQFGDYAEAVRIDDENNVWVKGYEQEYSIGNLSDLPIDGGYFNSLLNVNYENKYQNEFIEAAGVDYKELKKDFAESYKAFIGNGDALCNLVENYCTDQSQICDKIASVAQITGITLMIGAGFLTGGAAGAVFGAGQLFAIGGVFGDEVLETANILTSENNNSTERYKEQAKEFIMDLGLLASGSIIGQASSAVNMQLYETTKNQLLAKVSEIGVDASLGLLSDYIITGDADIQGEGLSQIIALITGMSSAKQELKNSYKKGTNIAEKTEYLNARAQSAKSIETTRTDLFDRLEGLYLKDVDEKIILDATAAKKSTYNLGRISDAQDILNNGANNEILMDISKEIASEAGQEKYITGTIQELEDGLNLSAEGKITKDEDNIYSQNIEKGVVSGRTKGVDSLYSKLKNKILKLNIDMPNTSYEALEAIGDLQGTRLVFNSEDIKIDTDKINIADLPIENKTEFFDYIRGRKDIEGITSQKINLYEQYKLDGLRLLAEAQSEEFVKSLCDSVEAGEIRISEINNYSSKDGIPYLSVKQIGEIETAYSNWFNKAFEDAQKGLNDYEVRTVKGVKKLYDPKCNTEFTSELNVKTSHVEPKAQKVNGYTCAQFNLYNKFGQSEELQFRGNLSNQISECEHIIYDIKNNKTTVSGPEYDTIRKYYNAIKDNKAAMKEYDRYFHDVYIATRCQELGVENVTMPDIKDYPLIQGALKNAKGIDKPDVKVLSVGSIQELHDTIKANKNPE